MKTIRKVEFIPVFVEEYLPKNEDVEEGKLYISRQFGCKHKCFCGCGDNIYIHFNQKTGWQLIEHENGKVTISPSLQHLNGCKSHYIITKNAANFV